MANLLPIINAITATNLAAAMITNKFEEETKMPDFGQATCCCKRCDCVEDCEYFQQSIQPVVEALNANYDPADHYMRTLENVLSNYDCEYFEPRN